MEEQVKIVPKEKKPKPNINYLRDKDREMVRGKFIFHEVPGGTVKFPFRKWKGDDVQMYELTDGHVYSIPLGVAKHLNQNCWYPIHAYQLDDNGKPVANVKEKKRRMSFQSLEFLDIDGMEADTSPIVEALTGII